jgi:4-amino-4-deoxy-L-arabinose transferase-like glycosyltransferase
MSLADRLRAWRDPALVLLAGVAACAAYGWRGAPLIADRAYHVYMGQAVLRGDALYGQTTFGYPPYGPLLSALAMRLAAPFGLPTYLAPRCLGVVVLLVLALLLYAVTKRAAGRSCALLAGCAVSGFGFLAILSVSGLEPVVLVALFTLAALWAAQRGSWLGAGLASGAAAMTWQPGVVVVAAIAVTAVLTAPRWHVRRVLLVGAGAALATLPAVVYILSTGSFEAFVFQTITRKLAYEQTSPETAFLSWLVRAPRMYWNDAVILLFAAAGFLLWFERRKPASSELPLVVMTVAWAAWFTIDFAAPKDLVPALPLLACWAAQLLVRLEREWRRSVALGIRAAFFALAFLDAAGYRPPYTLDEQLRDAKAILGSSAHSFLAFNADELYVLTDTRAPIRYTRLGPWIDAFAAEREPGGVPGLAMRIEQLRPGVIVIRSGGGPSRLRAALEPLLAQYERTVVRPPYAYSLANMFGSAPRPEVEVFRLLR